MVAGEKRFVSPGEVKALIGSGGEYALIDVRDEGDFSCGHQLLAVNIPLSCLELRMPAMVPRKDTRVILVDAGPDDPETPAARAFEKLARFGYANVAVMAGGMPAWVREGFKIFSGVFVPSKAFGEFVEHAMETPRLEPEKVKAMLDGGHNMVILDTRPNNEFQRMNIPSGVNVPGGELVYRIADIAPDPETLVVVNCAGRTRSIIGCQSLINAGVPNTVAALKGGTMGWELAGLKTERGTMDRYNTAPPSGKAVTTARERAAAVAAKYGVRFAAAAELAAWRVQEDRNLYVIDVRQPAEFEEGHMPGSVNVQGVTMVQSTDAVIGVRNGRIVLVDDTEVRAVMTASWLVQMGYPDVYVLRGGICGERETGPAAPVILGEYSGFKEVFPEELRVMMDAHEPALVIDIGNSRNFRKGHIPGARWGIRSRLAEAHRLWPHCKEIVVTCDNGLLARIACRDVSALWKEADVMCLKGGNAAWIASGLPVEKDMKTAFSPERDVYNRPYEGIRSKKEEREAMIAYLSWEEGLVADVGADGDLRFNIK